MLGIVGDKFLFLFGGMYLAKYRACVKWYTFFGKFSYLHFCIEFLVKDIIIENVRKCKE